MGPTHSNGKQRVEERRDALACIPPSCMPSLPPFLLSSSQLYSAQVPTVGKCSGQCCPRSPRGTPAVLRVDLKTARAHCLRSARSGRCSRRGHVSSTVG